MLWIARKLFNINKLFLIFSFNILGWVLDHINKLNSLPEQNSELSEFEPERLLKGIIKVLDFSGFNSMLLKSKCIDKLTADCILKSHYLTQTNTQTSFKSSGYT